MVKGLILVICCFIQCSIGFCQIDGAKMIFDSDLLDDFVRSFPVADKMCFYENSIYSSEVYETKSILLLVELKLHKEICFYDDVFDITEVELAKLRKDSTFQDFILENDYNGNYKKEVNPFLRLYFTLVLNKYQEEELYFINSIRKESLNNGNYLIGYINEFISDSLLKYKVKHAFKFKSTFSREWKEINNSILMELDPRIDTSGFQYRLFFELFSFYNKCENLNEIDPLLLNELNLRVNNIVLGNKNMPICIFKNYENNMKMDDTFMNIVILYGDGKIKNISYTYKFKSKFKHEKLNQQEFLKFYKSDIFLKSINYLFFDQNQNRIIKTSTKKLDADYFLIVDKIGQLEDVFYVYR